MQNRLLERACRTGRPLAPRSCAKTSRRCCGARPTRAKLRTARRLFARALEAKGGLKIHTIHGFCERLLQRFPLESQVTPHFSVLDEREQALMRRAAFDAAVVARRRRQRRRARQGAGEGHRAHHRGTYPPGGRCRARQARRACRAWWPITRAATTGPRPRRCALKRLFDVAEHDEEALIEQLAGVLTDEEIDAAIAALRGHCGADRNRQERRSGVLREARVKPGRGPRGGAQAGLPHGRRRAASARVCSKGFAASAPAICATLDRGASRFRRRSPTSSRMCAWPRRAPRCSRWPTRCRPTMSGASRPRPRSTMTI